jgi:hypothetical protein
VIATIAALVKDPKSDLVDRELHVGPGFLVVRTFGSATTHIVRADNDTIEAEIVTVFGSVGWRLSDRPIVECGAKLRRPVIVMNSDVDVTCHVCKYAYEGWL